MVEIVDAHHHLYGAVRPGMAAVFGGRERFLIDDLRAASAGLPLAETVCVEAGAMYRQSGPEAERPIGETEFLNDQATIAAAQEPGPRAGAGIVARVDLRLGDAVTGLLEEHLAAAPGRLRGIRQSGAWDDDPAVIGAIFDHGPQLYRRDDFRAGFRHLAPLGLSFDAFVLAPQLDDVVDLARAFPGTPIALCHLGIPLGFGRHHGHRDEGYAAWKRDITALAGCPNISVKLGGLGSYLGGFPSYRADPPFSAEMLAREWQPYIEPCIALFGAGRCMFESNFPVDGWAGSYAQIWAAFDVLSAAGSDSERAALFAGTARHFYRLDAPYQPSSDAVG